ncbi:toll/interleukin-1 receptor domain-containing protein [Hydrogenophaga sp.]|uniref:toll/interleukin-1 receptor domain-containing protein n=1 Tax=Hydrogenophaga sp. TaxID=1904254 RepID=UPI0035626A4B
MKDFFVSYNRADKGWAEWIAWQLEAAGYKVVIQAWDFREGGNYVLDMQRAIESARRTILVLSPDALKSQFVAPEWAAAFAQDPSGESHRLLPVRVRECQPGGLLAQIVYVDLVGLKDRAQAQQRLLQGVAEGRAKPDHEPDMPPLEAATSPPQALDEEPPWPPSLEVASSVAGHVFWRIVRFAALLIGSALILQFLLGKALPNWAANSPGAAIMVALVWGLIITLALEALLRLWQRRSGARWAHRSPS